MTTAFLGPLPALASDAEIETSHAAGNAPATWVQTGMASFYGRWHSGRLTSSGERFNPAAMTCAHRTLPMHAIVRVTVIDSGATLVLVVNDRGPYIHHRVLDMSQGAARRLGMDHDGLARVRIEQIGQEEDEVAMAEPEEDHSMTGGARVHDAPRRHWHRARRHRS